MIKQIVNSKEGGFGLFGMQFGMITIVGIVRSTEHSSTKITYTLEDHTGQIEAHLWLEEGDIANLPTLLLNTYARVHGAVRTQSGTKAIMIFKIESLGGPNELTTHLLQVLNSRYMAEEFSKGGGGDTSGTDAANGNAAFASTGAFTTTDSHSGLKGKQLAVFDAVKNHKSEQGISITELQMKFSHISSAELQ